MDDGVASESGTARLGPNWPMLSVGGLLLVASAAAWGFGDGYAQAVDPSQGSYGFVYEGGSVQSWLIHGLVIAVAVLLCAGSAPRKPAADRVGARFGLWLIVLLLPASVGAGQALGNAFFFAQPGEGCAKPGCWPLYQQSGLIVLPAVLTAVAALVVALVAARGRRRVPWVVISCVPCFTWIGASVVLRLCWLPLVIPWLTADGA